MSDLSQRRPFPTAHDVARTAGVSQSAVSRAFTDGASISDRTRAKVTEAAEALGYRPNLVARSLITQRSSIVGVAVGPLENPFYSALIEALGRELAAVGRRQLLFTGDPRRPPDPILEDVLRYRLDALILAATTLSSPLSDQCRAAKIPVVLVNRETDEPDQISVTSDNEAAGRAVAAHLINGEHRRFAFIAGLEDSSTSRSREEGFTAALLDAGMKLPIREVGRFQADGARTAMRALLRAKEVPDAVFCANDLMAFAAIEVARHEFGLDVGRTISIVGFDDIEMAAWPSWSLSTYAQPVAEMARQVVALIIGGRLEPARVRVPGRLIERLSSRPAGRKGI